MDIIINSDLGLAPEHALLLKSQSHFVLNLLVSLGYNEDDPPLADLLKRMHQLHGDWLVLSPIHWEASHNNATIVATGNELGMNEEQFKHCFNAFAQFLAEDNLQLYYHDAHTWLLQVDLMPCIHAKPVYQIINHPLMPELAALDATMHWQRLFTESQMFFATQQEQSLINGVWFWGGAALAKQSVAAICADAASLSLAQYCSSQVTLYNPGLKLKDYDMVLIDTLDSLSEPHQEELKKLSGRWYWNNTAYTQTTHWLTRLWRTLIHAH